MATIIEDWSEGSLPSFYTGDTTGLGVVSKTLGSGTANSLTETDPRDIEYKIFDDDGSLPTLSQGYKFDVWARHEGDTVGAEGAISGIAFGVQDSSNYYLAGINTDAGLDLAKLESGSVTTIASSGSQELTDEDYRIVVEWTDNGDIILEARDTTDTVVETISATDTTYTSGGLGFGIGTYGGAFTSSGWVGDARILETPLAAPTNVQIIDDATEDELTLDWDEVSDATGYYVYRAEQSESTKSDYTQVADVTSPPYTDTGLEDGERYYYRVSAYN